MPCSFPAPPARPRPIVLVIEDDDDLARLLGMHIRALGFDVQRAATGAEGLRLARAIHPDLVILDLGLPDLHGSLVLTALRAQPETRDCPVIATSIIDPDQFPDGFDDLLPKPFSRAMLHRVLRTHLSPSRPPLS
jgi:DNA-binding response OmpR family regulator